MRRLLCNVFGHVRDRRRARHTSEGWRSACVFCHTPLIRVAPREWQPYSKCEHLASDQLDFLGALERRPGQSKAADR